MQLIGMMLLITLMPIWLLGCFVLTQRHSLTMAQLLDAQLAQEMIALPTKQVLTGIVVGLIYGVGFNVPDSQLSQVLYGNAPAIAMLGGQLLLWALVGLLISVRLHVVNKFYQLGKSIKISIFEQSQLAPFARVGMLDVLIVVGGMAVATVQSIDAQFRLGNYLTAALVAVPAGIALLVRPMWSIHKRLVTRKAQLFDDVTQKIAAASERGSETDIAALELLLRRRDRVRALHTWPLDVAIWSRLFFYILIPPIAWSGAALVEMIINRILDV
jgi:hypothetical protein